MTATAAVKPGCEHTFNSRQASTLAFNVAVLVELLRRRDVGVAKDELGVSRRYAGILEESRGGMPQVMQRQSRETRLCNGSLKSPTEVVRLDGGASATEEHETYAVACIPWSIDPISMRYKGIERNVEQRQVSLTGLGLDRSDRDSGAHVDNLVSDANHSVSGVDVVRLITTSDEYVRGIITRDLGEEWLAVTRPLFNSRNSFAHGRLISEVDRLNHFDGDWGSQFRQLLRAWPLMDKLRNRAINDKLVGKEVSD